VILSRREDLCLAGHGGATGYPTVIPGLLILVRAGGACRARLWPLQPIRPKQLDRVQRADCAVPACQAISRAVLRASPADAFRVSRKPWCASHAGQPDREYAQAPQGRM